MNNDLDHVLTREAHSVIRAQNDSVAISETGFDVTALGSLAVLPRIPTSAILRTSCHKPC